VKYKIIKKKEKLNRR